MKLYNKSELTFNNGYITDANGDIIVIGNSDIIGGLNQLETEIQLGQFNIEHSVELPSEKDTFHRKSSFQSGIRIEVETPLLDKKAEETMNLLSELNKANQAEVVNKYVAMYDDLVEWVREPQFVGTTTSYRVDRIDTPTLGNPLELTIEKLQEVFPIAANADLDRNE